MSKERAKLKDFGYYTDNLWSVEDVKSLYECDDETAYNILDRALDNESVRDAIWWAIEFEIDELKNGKVK